MLGWIRPLRLPFVGRDLIFDFPEFAPGKWVAPVRIDGADMDQARLFHHSTRGGVDRHGCGDNPSEIVARECHGDQRDRALRGQASTPGVATEPVAEFPDAFAPTPEREPPHKGARARLDSRPDI